MKNAVINVELQFDAPMSLSEESRFVKLLAEELTFGDNDGTRYRKSGWGMGQARCIKVGAVKLKAKQRASRDSPLVVELYGDYGAVAPGEKRGHFKLYGRVIEGIKSALGRQVEVRFKSSDKSTFMDLITFVEEYPNTGEQEDQ